MHSRHTAIILSSILLGLLGASLIPTVANRIPVAFACGSCPNSSSGTMTLDPSSGPVGTIVTAQITLTVNSTVTFSLAFTTVDPASAGCAQGQSSASVPALVMPPTIQSDTTYERFRWPTEFGPGKYWFCAIPQSAGVPTVASALPFIVAAGTLPAPAVQVDTSSNLPGHGSLVGDIVTVTITNWQTVSTDNPEIFLLARGASPDQMIDVTNNIQFLQGDLAPAPPAYRVFVPLPGTLAPGAYAIVVQGDCSNGTCTEQAQSAFFTLQAVSAAVQPSATQQGNIFTDLLQQPLLIALGLGLLILVIVLLLLIPIIRRRQPMQWSE